MRRNGRATCRTVLQLLGLLGIVRSAAAGPRIRLAAFGYGHRFHPRPGQVGPTSAKGTVYGQLRTQHRRARLSACQPAVPVPRDNRVPLIREPLRSRSAAESSAFHWVSEFDGPMGDSRHRRRRACLRRRLRTQARCSLGEFTPAFAGELKQVALDGDPQTDAVDAKTSRPGLDAEGHRVVPASKWHLGHEWQICRCSRDFARHKRF